MNDRIVSLVANGFAAALAGTGFGMLILVGALAVLPRMVVGDLCRAYRDE